MTGPRNFRLWQRAAGFAARVHGYQVRKDGVTPYISHPFRVAMTVRDVFGCDDPVVLAAALLHDTIEDSATDYDELSEAFGAGVAGCVAALTKNKSLPERAREADYDARLERADWRARLIKLADTFDNLTDALERADGPAAGVKKMVGKCRRAVTLARADASRHVETRAAVKAVRALVKRAEGRRRKLD